MGFTPLQITFFMRTPILLAHPWIHFDGLLAHIILRSEMGEKYYLLPAKQEVLEIYDILKKTMPLKLVRANGYEFWSGSVSFFQARILGGATIYKRFHTRAIGLTKSRKKRVDIVRGYYKMYAMRLPMIVTKQVVFFACGKRGEIEELLPHVTGLGKKRVIGWGAVKGFEITELDTDMSVITTSGRVMRPVPVRAFTHMEPEKIDIAKCSYKPPYWWKKNVDICVLPNSKLRNWKL